MSDRRWTYKQITERSEERIATYVRMAHEAAADDLDPARGRDAARAFGYIAEGAFETWLAVVGGERREKDTERLRLLMLSAVPGKA